MREKRKKNKMNWKPLWTAFLLCLLLAGAFGKSFTAYAAEYVKPDGYIAWSSLSEADIRTSTYIGMELDDFKDLGINMTTEMSLGNIDNRTYDVIHYYVNNKVTYQKKIRVNHNQKISFIGSILDSGYSNSSLTSFDQVSWNVMEWDINGNFAWDSGWLDTNTTYSVGTDSRGSCADAWGNNYATASRNNVAYITLIFKYKDNRATTADDFYKKFPHLYLCYTPFKHGVIHGSTTTYVERLGTTTLNLLNYPFDDKVGYLKGWKITNSSTNSNNWMKKDGQTYTMEQVNTWLSNGRFYYSLFANCTFKSAYIPIQYTITYNPNGGTGIVISSMHTYDKEGERLRIDHNFSKTHYTFGGWSTAQTGAVQYANGANVKNLSITNGGNVNLYAQWIPNVYTITLDNQGATTAGTDKYYQKYDSGNYSDAGCTTATSSITVPQKNGYKFNGYYTGTNGSGTQYINSAGAISSTKTTFTTNTTLYAYWTVDAFLVKYHANGGSTTATEKIYYYGEAVDLSPTATKDGYTFVGWSTLQNARLPLISYSMPDKAVTLYAIYTINVSDVQNHEYPSYTGTPLVDNDEVYFLVWIKGDSSIYKYYPLTFKGNVGHMTYQYELPSTDVSAFVNGQTYCYQIIAWDNAGNKAVLYDGSSDGTPIPPGDVPEEPVKYTQTVEHYKYNAATGSWGWFKDTKTFVVEGCTFTPSYTTPPTGYQTDRKDGGGIVTGNKTYKAYYKPINYLVTFHANGGSCNTASKYVAYEGYYGTLPTATKTGQEFAGWNTKQDGTGKTVLSSDIYTMAGPTTLYAQYKANTYRIVLDNQGATTAGTLEYFQKYNAGNYTTQECNTAIASIVIPQKKGYTFGGYYTGTNGSGTQHINSAGVIGSTKTTFTVDTTLYAAWTENSYTIRYHANGGTGTMADTEAVYDTSVTLRANSFERTGYTFAGWSTSPTGSKVYNDLDSVKNLTAASGEVITLYAVWSLNSYLVIYDYQTNGGSSASVTEKMVGYGSDIDLSVAAVKEGYTFVGWNTDASATTKLTSLTMTTEPVVLFAIFQKTITVIFVEMGDAGTVTNSVSKTVYNNTKYADFLMEEKTSWSSWKNAGWTNETAADADALVSTAGTYRTDKSITLYALYTSDVTVSYDTNGSHATYESQTKPRYYNASGNSMYPAFTIAKAPKLSGNSFVNWIGKSGREYASETNAVIEESVCLTAKWDAHPVLEGYNRYFTLEQAQSGAITQEELLKKVIGTDKEDGTLLNGTSVVVKDYSASTFTGITADKEVEITYQARDSFGNTVTKKVSVFITDTLVKEGRKKHYVRFISFDFWRDDSGNLLAAEQGGVEKTSVWRINSNYRMLLEKTLSNQNTYKESWIFTPQDIQSIKDSTRMYGHISNALEQFLKLFEKCKENKNPTG